MSNLNKPKKPKNQFQIIIFIIIVGFILYFLLSDNSFMNQTENISYSTFNSWLEQDKISTVLIKGNDIFFNTNDNEESSYKYKTYIPYIDSQLIETLKQKENISFKGEQPSDSSGTFSLILMIIPTLLLIFFVYSIFSKQMKGANNQAFSFGKSKAKMLKKTDIRYKDVAGIDEAKQELEEVVDYLKNPLKFTSLGARVPKGVLLQGPPGCGKTLLAKATAGEADVPFFSISGSEFVEMFVGVGASRVRDLFNKAKANSPSIIFVDELDAVGRSRGAGLGGGHDEREQTLNQILVEMDGFETNDQVIVMAATNRADILDKALLRPGRFDRKVSVGRPDVKGRYKILQIHGKKIPLADDVELFNIAKGTPGFSGADLANLVNEAAILAARFNKKNISMEHMEEAKDKVLMGPQRRSLLMNDEEKKLTAYHEAGHTIVGILLKSPDPVYKVTIIPRGFSLGATHHLPDQRNHYSKNYFLQQICILLAGRVAEEVKFNELYTGASNDIERATQLAHDMVCKYGMSDLGPIQFGENQKDVFLGRDLGKEKEISEETAKKIDIEINKIITSCLEKTRKLIKENMDKLERISINLIEKETLTSKEIYNLLEMDEPDYSKEYKDYESQINDEKDNVDEESNNIEDENNESSIKEVETDEEDD